MTSDKWTFSKLSTLDVPSVADNGIQLRNTDEEKKKLCVFHGVFSDVKLLSLFFVIDLWWRWRWRCNALFINGNGFFFWLKEETKLKNKQTSRDFNHNVKVNYTEFIVFFFHFLLRTMQVFCMNTCLRGRHCNLRTTTKGKKILRKFCLRYDALIHKAKFKPIL